MDTVFLETHWNVSDMGCKYIALYVFDLLPRMYSMSALYILTL